MLRKKRDLGKPTSRRVIVEFSDGDAVDEEHQQESDADFKELCECYIENGKKPPSRKPIKRTVITTYWRK